MDRKNVTFFPACVNLGAPIVVSFPHFHLGDEEYIDAIDGISPVREHHQTYVDLNPVWWNSLAVTQYSESLWPMTDRWGWKN